MKDSNLIHTVLSQALGTIALYEGNFYVLMYFDLLTKKVIFLLLILPTLPYVKYMYKFQFWNLKTAMFQLKR